MNSWGNWVEPGEAYGNPKGLGGNNFIGAFRSLEEQREPESSWNNHGAQIKSKGEWVETKGAYGNSRGVERNLGNNFRRVCRNLESTQKFRGSRGPREPRGPRENYIARGLRENGRHSGTTRGFRESGESRGNHLAGGPDIKDNFGLDDSDFPPL